MDSFQDTLREQDAIFYATFPAAAAAAAACNSPTDYSYDAAHLHQVLHHRQLIHHAPYPPPYQLQLPPRQHRRDTDIVPAAARSLPDYVPRPSAPPPPDHQVPAAAAAVAFRQSLPLTLTPPPTTTAAATGSGSTPPAAAPPALAAAPPPRRVQEKKPPLACLFCRGRKIACGSPLPGSTDKTCNQCQRRSLPCEYPSESRRGMRKKKTVPASASDAAAAAAQLPQAPDSPAASTPDKT